VLGHFTPDAIHVAKEALWSSASPDVIGKMTSRRGSQNKLKEEFELDDIIDALNSLDQNDATPIIHVPALELMGLPRMKPEEAISLQMIERLNDLEQRVDDLSDKLCRSAGEKNELHHRVKKLELHSQTSAPEIIPASATSISQHPPPVAPGFSCIPSAPPLASTDWPSPAEAAGATNVHDFNTVVKKNLKPMAAARAKPIPRQVVRQATSKLRTVKGTSRAESGTVRGSLPAKHLYVFHVNPDVSTDDLKKHIVKSGVPVRGIHRISRDDWLHGTYKVDINARDLDRVMDKNFWPEEICCREWMPVIPSNTDRKNEHGDTSK
jgi:hypothetical protein